jgi:ferredoxin
MHDDGSFEVEVEHAGTIAADPGRRLVLALEDAGHDILHRCGGNARCATCRVEVLAGDPTPITEWEERRLSELSKRHVTTRLSCQIRVTSDLSVRICNRLSAKPELGDAGPRPIEWPRDRAMPPDS